MKFKVKVPGTKNYFSITVTIDVDDMLAAKKKAVGLEKNDEKCLALIKTFENFSISKRTGERLRSPLIGNIFLNENNLSTAEISKMMIHASIHADRILFGNKRAMFGMRISDKELRLVTVVGNMIDSLTTQMLNAGL